jgi:hypothetical protein
LPDGHLNNQPLVLASGSETTLDVIFGKQIAFLIVCRPGSRWVGKYYTSAHGKELEKEWGLANERS